MNRRAWLLGSAAAAAVAAGFAVSRWRATPAVGTVRAPTPQAGDVDLWSMRFERPDGGELVMAELRGKPLLLNFWATWCAPCIAEMPMLDAFQREHAARGWRVVGLAVDNPVPVRDFVRRQRIEFAIGLVGFEGADLARELGNRTGSLPFSVVFGRDGKAVQRKLGAIKPEDLQAWVRTVG
jgi:thiol-disulfide isomerase/thioredoxin